MRALRERLTRATPELMRELANSHPYKTDVDYLVDDVLSAIAAAGNAAGLGTIAMLGLDAKALEEAVWDWQFSPENKREYGYEALVSWCAERAKAKSE